MAPEAIHRLHDVLELASFAATTILLPLGAITLIFTAVQVREAANTRIATVYLQITELWGADKAVASRMWVTGLDDRYTDAGYMDALKAASTSSPDYIRQSIEAEEKRDRLCASGKTYILVLLENIGVLCREKFVSAEVVVAFIGPPIVWQMDLLAEYVASLRKDDPSAYCNAAELYRVAKRAGH